MSVELITWVVLGAPAVVALVGAFLIARRLMVH